MNPWEEANNFLAPMQGVVTVLLVLVIVMAVLALWSPPAVRTALVVWFLFP